MSIAAGSGNVRVLVDTKGEGLDALLKRLTARQMVVVGVPEGKSTPEGTSLAQVAAWTEFGTETSPERPFLRGGIRASLPMVRKVAAHDLAAVAEGKMTTPVALERTGMVVVGEVKRYMTGPHFAPNAPATVKQKGSSQPTIDSAQLRAAVTAKLEPMP